MRKPNKPLVTEVHTLPRTGRMKILISVLMIVVLATGCVSVRRHYVDYDIHTPKPEKYGDVFDWQNNGPIEFIEQLKSGKNGSYSVQGQHYGWILKDDIPELIKLLDSKEVCLSVSMTISSHWGTKGSTVGHEAAYLIQGFINGVFPHELNSTRWKLEGMNKHRFNEWCERFMKNLEKTNTTN